MDYVYFDRYSNELNPIVSNVSTVDFSFNLGILTALVACFIDIIIDQLSTHKYSFLKHGEFYLIFGIEFVFID